MSGLGTLERDLINRYQGDFPLGERPFAAVAQALGGDEEQIIDAIGRLLEQGLLSRFGPLYNAERMGGGLVLAALIVPETDYQRVTDVLNAIPEVAHNYRRDHRLNMWFVLATGSPAATQAAIDGIEQAAGLKVYAFPKEREFYLGLWLHLEADGAVDTRSFPIPAWDNELQLDDLDRAIISATQGGLPLTPAPYAAVARDVDCSLQELEFRLRGMLDSGAIRRIGLVPNHYKLGLRGNGMTVWDIPDQRLEEVGRRMGGLDYVSHCYARPRHLPDWSYNLFAMVHGSDRDQVRTKVAAMSELLAGEFRAHDVLFSSAVLKKTGLRLPD